MSHTTFLRKTKRGGIIKVIREHYLRDDIYCGFSSCALCQEKSFLSSNEAAIIPDTNILYHQVDVMEHSAVENVIILQTVLQELKHRSISIYARIRSLIADPKKKFFVFCNEHHRETFVKKDLAESPNDRNDRAIRRAVEWYASHIAGFGGKVVLITDDRDSRNRALSEGLAALSAVQFVESKHGHPALIDLVAASADDEQDPASRFSYPEHMSATQISAGLKSGAFYQGVLGISTHNFLEATAIIKIRNEEKTIHIAGRENLNRGVQGDVVAIHILPESEWMTTASSVIKEEDVAETDAAADSVAVDPNAMQVDDSRVPTGRVVGIIKRNWRPFCGTIDASSVQETSTLTALQSVFFWSMDKRIPKIRIRTRQAKALIGKRIVVCIDSWDRTSRYPSGHFVRTLGDVGEKQTETEVLLLEHDVPFAPFSPLVLSFLPEEGENWIVTDDHKHKREDFRGLDICSIDPPGCTDIDDALHARQLENGNYEVGVHIADVSHFVKPGNAMDDEAQRRGTTVYLVDKRIDMLPGLLGTSKAAAVTARFVFAALQRR
ncbi:exosome catalytic subunit dis3 [Kappamyces sp. JEL0680]|nr:exosome catalytic subunit dis3 [Kappamyces sp. JEL0680]